jgi:hypothetical protein
MIHFKTGGRHFQGQVLFNVEKVAIYRLNQGEYKLGVIEHRYPQILTMENVDIYREDFLSRLRFQQSSVC